MRLIVLIGFAFLLSMGIAQADDWPMFGHDAAHTGVTNEVVEPPLELLWKYTMEDDVFSPVVSGDVVFVSTWDFWNDNVYLYALDTATGTLKWKHQSRGAVPSSPAISGNVVYYIGDGGSVYALDMATGTLKWIYTTRASIYSSPTVSDGVIFIGTCNSGNDVYALYAATGVLKWKYETGGSVVSSPAVSDGVVYVGSWDSNVYALDEATGTLKWKQKIGGLLDSPTVSDGIVYVGSTDSNVYALDAATGALKWKYKTGNSAVSSPAVSDSMVYVGSQDSNVYALDGTTGALKWKFKTGNCVAASPAVSGDVVYVGSGDSNLYALDGTTGAIKWKYETGGSVVSSPVISGGVVYVGSTDRNLYAFKPSEIAISEVLPETIQPILTTTPTGNLALETPETQNHINWMLVSAILLILLIGAVALLWRKSKDNVPRTIKKQANKEMPAQRYKTLWIILIILLIIFGAFGYIVYQKYSPLSELAKCENCIDYKKVNILQYESSVPDIKITGVDVEKLIIDVPIIIHNPSIKDTETVKINFDIYMEGRHLTQGTIPAYELPAKQNTTILIKDVAIRYEELGEVLQIVIEKHGAEVVREGKANISMTTDLLIYFPIEIFSINIYTFTIPIQIETEVPVDMLKQNEDAKKQIEEKVKIAIKEVQDKTNGGLPDIPTEIPTPTMVPTSTPTQPLPTSSLLI